MSQKKGSTVRTYLREFSEGTTLHGVRYVGEQNRHWTERSCWIVAMITCTVLCGLEVLKVWYRWQEAPIIISFASHPTRVREIPFPAVTVCPGMQIPKDTFDISKMTVKQFDDDKDKSLPNVLIGENLTDEEILQVEAATIACTAVDSHNHSFSINQTHFQTLYDMTPDMNYFIHECTFNGTHNCTNYFRPMIFTERGICHTFNMLKDTDLYVNHAIEFRRNETMDVPFLHNVTVKGGGSHWGLQLMLKVPLDQEQSICCLENNNVCQTNFEVYLHTPMELAWYNPVLVTPWSDTDVRLRPVVTKAAKSLGSYSTDIRGCRFPQDQKLKYFKSYTRNHCWVECFNHRIERQCSCRAPNVPMDPEDPYIFKYCQRERLRDCTPLNNPENEPEMCKFCLPACDGIEYELDIDRGILQEHELTKSQIGRPYVFRRRYRGNETRYAYARIRIYFNQQEYIGIQRSEVFGFTDVLSNCGGLLGLFTGFSVITIIELLYFATLRLCCNLRLRRDVKTNDSEKTSTNDINEEHPVAIFDSNF